MIDTNKVLQWMVDEDRTVEYLARSSGVDAGQLLSLMAGRAPIDPETVAALERAMDLPEGDLLLDKADAQTGHRLDPLHCFTIDEVAVRMRVHPDTVRKEIRSGRLPHIIVGDRGIRIPYVALAERLSLPE